MLQSLRIRNYALITEMEMDFQNGFSVITGETGAGKSILLGGLGLVLGNRADMSALRNAEAKCVIEAEFSISKYELQSFFRDQDLDYEATSILRREILPSGKSRAFVNDSPVNLQTLQKLGKQLIDVHSQHQTLALTQDGFLLQFVDAVAGNLEILKSYRAEFESYKQKQKRLTLLQQEAKISNDEADYNQFLLEELLSAKLDTVNIQALEAEQEALSNVESIKENLSQAQQVLSDETMGLLQTMGILKQNTTALANFGKNYIELQNRVQSLYIETDDIYAEVENMMEQLTDDPHALATVNDRLELLYALLQKHQVQSVEALLEVQNTLDEKVQNNANLDTHIAQLETELAAIEASLQKEALHLQKNRLHAIPQLKEKLERALKALGMPNAEFSIELEDAEVLHADGIDKLQFLFSANKGAAFGSLKKVASGGELSRIMLSMKSILAGYMSLPTIMFDEIDTGVSGDIAQKMGEIMRWMSKNMQVFSITHLPQVAAKGQQHYKVYKQEQGERTISQMKILSKEERILELAEMLGGKEISDSALAHAKELLEA
ncbi:MAG: DNA repair protein RecN [Flavobacteriaceae bacterium]|nr:DNA repair protein RecN [Flavobacteriaceae bacterium]